MGHNNKEAAVEGDSTTVRCVLPREILKNISLKCSKRKKETLK